MAITPIDMLTDVDREMICAYINQYAPSGYDDYYYPNVKDSDLSFILGEWDSSKAKNLFSMMGNELVLTRGIQYQKDSEELYEDIEIAQASWWQDANPFATFLRKYNKVFSDNTLNSINARRVIHTINLAANSWTYDFAIEITTPQGKKIKATKGTKISKVLGKIAKAFNIPGYEEFRIYHSQLLNQKTLTGDLCISIHPLDYMTMSDNTCGWESCMAWQNSDGGEYRQGTVEMMNSPMVIVAYLTSSDEMHIVNNHYWNSKKWRELYVINDEIITNIKSYPYKNEELTKICLSWIKELQESNVSDNEYEDEIATYATHEISVSPSRRKFYVSPRAGHMYSDFSNNQLCYLTKKNKNIINSKFDGDYINISFNFSGKSQCMCCGDTCYTMPTDRSLLCENCEPVCKCEHCGEVIRSMEYAYKCDDALFCEYCYEENCYYDEFTQSSHMICDADELYICDFSNPGNEVYYETFIHVYRASEINWSDYSGSVYRYKIPYTDEYRYFIDEKSFTDYGERFFYIYPNGKYTRDIEFDFRPLSEMEKVV